jgi:phosphatidylglycerol lysyltransferase
MADRHEGWTVFYEVKPRHLPLYLDLGLTLIKIGEEAHVPLDTFSLEGRGGKDFRHLLHHVAGEGCSFELIPPERVSSLFRKLKQISDAWLAEKNTREKRFSLGSFQEVYIRHFPAAIVRREGKVLAFANVWLGAEKEELSFDLMRYLPESPHGVMDYLFIQLMLWGKQEGYRWFNLGMAPLSGLGDRVLSPLWSRLGAFIFRHGEHFYNFQGLRQYKEKFDPQWEPRYLVTPAGLALPRILTNLATLISGGLKGIAAK